MFLRKLFSSKNKFAWVIIDLVIVIIGVYSAFLIQSSAENRKLEVEKEKIMSALKFELEFFRIEMPGRGSYSEGQAKEWKTILDSGKYVDLMSWRFIEPQYNYQVIEHAINHQNSSIIDFDLYDALQRLFVEIKRIEYAERLMTQVAMEFQTIPSNFSKETEVYSQMWAGNYDSFRRMIQFMYDRSGNQTRLGEESSAALELVNNRLSVKRRKEIEREMIVNNLHRAKSEDQAVGLVKQLFPDFEEKEVREIYNSSKKGE